MTLSQLGIYTLKKVRLGYTSKPNMNIYFQKVSIQKKKKKNIYIYILSKSYILISIMIRVCALENDIITIRNIYFKKVEV